ncbi:DUF2235 domain-containing protein [Paraferrimonas sp. SM1919]|uniref:DUF2235 domain-containing protein n=1 Tax=Paraferrimonas sp. SM1919 TaxID=2662263 RepID=UPI0013D41044|nr:DUF2235 domain-containing protein [Paraferrimonas sp. SM1919]
MANIIVCCDGTWNNESNQDDGVPAPTNVLRIFYAVNKTQQKAHYQAGVGTGKLWDKIVGGAVGSGISTDICECYLWLCRHYQSGDKLFLFGFSRGAYTARSLGGMIGRYGLLDLSQSQSQINDVQVLYNDGYRQRKTTTELDYLNFSYHPDSQHIEFIGVFDTVGALGIPNDKEFFNLFDNPEKYQFHDTKLGDTVKHACHAVAIDEKRGSFTPTLWQADPRVKQRWFAGVHSDIGGGYKENGLSDCTLDWIIQEAQSHGLLFSEHMLEQIQPNPLGRLHNSYKGVMKVLRSNPRAIPRMDAPEVDQTAKIRLANPPINQGFYRPLNHFKNNQASVEVMADIRWNWTGVYLQKGKRYRFLATGTWFDRNICCGPGGCDDGNFQFAEAIQAVGSLFGKAEKLFNRWFHRDNKKYQVSDFPFTKRVEDQDWFCLMGAIPKAENPDKDGSFVRPELFHIGDSSDYSPQTSGYLYCFANDAWGMYGNNSGEVSMIITELD